MRYANESARIESVKLRLIQMYSGLMPTTSAIAGTVRGIRQMNSTMRLRRGRRNRTHTMVGSSKPSIKSDVINASSRDTVIAVASSGVLGIAAHAENVRAELMPMPRVENSNIAPIGTRKNAAASAKITMRKAWSLMRRERVIAASPQPLGGPALEQRVQAHHDQHDRDHGQPGRARTGLAGEEGLHLQRHDHPALRQQCGGGSVGGERVREQQQRAAEE